MSTSARPKAILFDLGGVCVSSPFQAILDYEARNEILPGWVNYSISKSAPRGAWQRLETGAIPLDAEFFSDFSRDLHDKRRWQVFYDLQRERNPKLPKDAPPLPKVEGERLFNEMMEYSSQPDPWMFPALKNLKSSGGFVVAALSNTVIFPPGHALHRTDFLDDPMRGVFDVFISSAHVGLRKPDPAIYRLALKEMDSWAKAHGEGGGGRTQPWKAGIAALDVVFLDDIGENLREASRIGFRTIKVHMGRSFEAVEELEIITGLKLAGHYPKPIINMQPKMRDPAPKI